MPCCVSRRVEQCDSCPNWVAAEARSTTNPSKANSGRHSSARREPSLPRSEHQACRQVNGKVHYKDNWYARYRVAVEIDGPAYHQNERVQADKDRDNANLAVDDVKTFRFGPVAVTERACETAAMVAVTLQRNGWRGSPRRCRRPGCGLGSPAVSRPRRT
jgi:hypothetical protein